MDENKDYKTYDLNLATFLCVKGFLLLNIEDGLAVMNEPERKSFVFDNSDQLREMVRIFYYAKSKDTEIMVNAQEILQMLRTIKSKLYSKVAKK